LGETPKNAPPPKPPGGSWKNALNSVWFCGFPKPPSGSLPICLGSNFFQSFPLFGGKTPDSEPPSTRKKIIGPRAPPFTTKFSTPWKCRGPPCRKTPFWPGPRAQPGMGAPPPRPQLWARAPPGPPGGPFSGGARPPGGGGGLGWGKQPQGGGAKEAAQEALYFRMLLSNAAPAQSRWPAF